MKRDVRARLRTAKEHNKALAQYDDMRAVGRVKKAIVIVERHDGDIEILAQFLTPMEMGPLLLAAAQALEHADAGRRVVRLIAHQEPVTRGVHNQSAPMRKEITEAPDGMLIPPKGENFISCGECAHPTWFVLHHDAYDTPSRTACAHCGNEVKTLFASGVGHA
jgi:hypothetical protein